MSIVSSIAASGMAAAALRLQVSANNVANAATSGPLPGSTNSAVASPNVDLASEIVQQIMARVSFAANAQVMKTDAQMTAALFDITA
jgi:flagellar basal-body rod protein FlgC